MDRREIETIIETYVNPALLGHKGWIDLEDWKDGVLTIRFRGACVGCGGTQQTLNNTIIPTIKSHAPEIREVILAEGVSQETYDFVLSLFSGK